MATSRAQQVGIWIIAITLTVGTIGSFIAIVLGNENQQTATTRAAEEAEKAQADALAALEPLEGYSVTPFDAAAVDELKVEVLTEGTGEVVKDTDTIKASYTGWLADGTIFDSTKKKDTADAPISFPLNGVIKGWTNGLAGQKAGSVVKLTIPADQGYGASANGNIPANSPLQFIVIIQAIDPQAS